MIFLCFAGKYKPIVHFPKEIDSETPRNRMDTERGGQGRDETSNEGEVLMKVGCPEQLR